MNRRYFLKSSGIALAGFGAMAASPDILNRAIFAKGNPARKKIIIAIFQRGAADGLNILVPHGSANYYKLRPTIAVPKPGQQGGALDLNGYFGLHPALRSLDNIWRDGKLAVVHSVGSPNNTRSHFDAQDYMESGTPGRKSTRDGWLNRYFQNSKTDSSTPFRAIAMTQQIPRTLMGRFPTVAMTNLRTFAIRAGQYSGSVSGGFEGVWQQQADDSLSDAGKETFDAINFLKKANPAQYRPANGAQYPNGAFANNLRQIAQLVKAGIGLEAAFTDTPGLNWDTHSNQAVRNGSNGQLANLLQQYSRAIAAFVLDLGQYMDDVLIVTMSEFGRTARENGSRGTDHGHGNSMFVIGNNVNGGIYGDWKGLSQSGLHENRDLAVTTDFRDVLGEVVSKHLGATNLKSIFPDYDINQKQFPGFLR